MAHKDYVSRPRATKNKKNPYKPRGKKQAPKSSVKPIVTVICILLIVASFGFGLSFMSSNAPDVETEEIELSAPPKKSTPVEDDLPEIPEEEWTYIDKLKNKNVEVKGYDVEDKGPYQMQCGSFRKKEQAEQLKANIAFAGYGSEIRRTNGKNGVWYKVVVGPFERKRMAEKAKHKLKTNKINYCQIWLWT